MKKTAALLATLAFGGSIITSSAQVTWDYEIGTNTGTWNSNAASTTFLPAPEDDGGTARVRVGTGGGSFTMTNGMLVGVAPTNASVNKFSIYDWEDATTAFSLQFDVTFTGGSSGSWGLFAGNGASFSNNNGFTSTESFAGLRIGYGADGALSLSNRAGGSWASVSSSLLTQTNTYTFQLVGNNGAESIMYGTNSLAANSFDLWIDGLFITNLGKAQLANASLIDSFMFYGENSAGNVATITLDNMAYANYAVLIPEPSTMAMLGLAGLGFAGYVIRRRRRQP